MSEKPSETLLSEKPSETLLSEKPSETLMSEKPSETLLSEKQGWAFVLFKRMERSLRSFPFFIKEQNNFCVLFRSL